LLDSLDLFHHGVERRGPDRGGARFPLTGEEVMAAGVAKGPLVGEVMREVEAIAPKTRTY